MKCAQCGYKSERGNFCTNCGIQLTSNEERITSDSKKKEINETQQQETNKEQPENNTHTTTSQEHRANQETNNNFSDELTTVFSNFGHFFMTIIKNPSMANKANHHDFYSALITIISFSLFVSLTIFLPQVLYSRASWMVPTPSLFYEFIVPFILLMIVFCGFISLIFVATRLTKLDLSYLDVFGKYGAYVLPYGLLYVAGIFFSIGHLPVLPSILLTIGILGPIFVIPALILYEQETKGFDRIYTLLGLYFVEILFLLMISNSLFGHFLGELFY